MPSCHHCYANDARCRCGQCKAVYFCNRDCQIQAWPTHRPECKPQPQASIHATETMKSGSNVNNDLSKAQKEELSRKKDQILDVHTKDSIRIEESSLKKSKKKKKKAKHVNNVSTHDSDLSPEETTSIQPSEERKSNEVKLATKFSDKLKVEVEPILVQPVQNSKAIHDEWTNIDTITPKKSKKKKGKQSKEQNVDKKQRSQSMPLNSKPKTKQTKSNSFHGEKGISWGTVYAREFARCPGGGGAVPDEGSWALGLGKKIQDLSFGSIDAVESFKEKYDHETKQTHHTPRKERKAGERMHRMTERERKEILMQSEESHHQEVAVEHVVTGARRRRLSSSDECDSHIFATLCLEQANDFALIRSSREATCGCSCGDLLKKVSKMHIKKLVAWLHDREIDTSNMSKPELTALAKSIAKQEKNCSTEDCECSRNGIPCHQDVCSGCRDSCHNERYAYKRDEVHQYRLATLTKWNQEYSASVVVS